MVDGSYYFLTKIHADYLQQASLDVLIWQKSNIRFLNYLLKICFIIGIPVAIFGEALPLNRIAVWTIGAVLISLGLLVGFCLGTVIKSHLQSAYGIKSVKGSWNSYDLFYYRVKIFEKILSDNNLLTKDSTRLISEELLRQQSKTGPEAVLGIRTISALFLVILGSFLSSLFQKASSTKEMFSFFVIVLVLSMLGHFLYKQIYSSTSMLMQVFFKECDDYEEMRRLLASVEVRV